MERRTDQRPETTSEEARLPEVRVEGLSKSFNANRVLAGVDLTVWRQEIVAVVGGSGCGKTVLLDHIIGHLVPDSGRVLVANHDRPACPLTDLAAIDDDELDRIRMHWAVVFQHNALFSGTVFENIALWLREVKRLEEPAIETVARRAVSAVGLEASVLDKDRDELSGGMAKRVAVARAIAMQPVLMFYDEPTTGLDPHHASQIHELILSTHLEHLEGHVPRTTMVITHDKDLLRRLRPRVIMLHEGRVFFDDSYDQFERSGSEVIRPYFELMPVLQRRPP